MGAIEDAFVMVLPPPPVNGLGTTGGFKLMIEDRGNVGYDELYKAVQAVQAQGLRTTSALAGVFSGYQINVPQLFADVDRVKAKQLGVPLADDLPDLADQPRLAVRERLQPVRPDLPGARAGRRAVPLAAPKTSRS